ncbi:hypothetical protein CES85_4339 [Ochrobactrum quorumnocens]|uniref:Uncharacterized protein n=1 Tax=Ochrobactrum quorumnocens TaxID=271865 RepID=A0A248UB37_9HYPH|nr:hypothetical protein CES85_4339 [[Ochrobactrum] quorumnocens]
MALEHFQQKWEPVLRSEMRKTNSYSGPNDSILTGAAVSFAKTKR